jgi:hypothetical protein
MDLSLKPSFTRAEKLILRISERKDFFLEKFPQSSRTPRSAPDFARQHSSQRSLTESASDERLGVRQRTASNASTASSISSTGNPIWMNTRHDRTPTANTSPEIHQKQWSRVEENNRGVSTPDPTSSDESQARLLPAVRDTHYFETSISYKNIPLPIRVPLYSFPEEIGEVCDPSIYISTQTHLNPSTR